MPGLSLPKILTRRVGTSVVCDALMVVPPYPAPGASRPLGPPDGQPNTGPPTSTRRLRSARFSPGVPLGRQRSRPPVGQARVAGSGGGRREPADQGGSARVGRGRALVLCATRLGHCPGGSTGSPPGARTGRGRFSGRRPTVAPVTAVPRQPEWRPRSRGWAACPQRRGPWAGLRPGGGSRAWPVAARGGALAVVRAVGPGRHGARVAGLAGSPVPVGRGAPAVGAACRGESEDVPGLAQPVPSAAGAAAPGVHRPSGPRGAGGGGGGGGGSSGQDGRPRAGRERRPRRGGSTRRIWVGAP